jgi:hypothetical protein
LAIYARAFSASRNEPRSSIPERFLEFSGLRSDQQPPSFEPVDPSDDLTRRLATEAFNAQDAQVTSLVFPLAEGLFGAGAEERSKNFLAVSVLRGQAKESTIVISNE